ncbi:hypothetical protein BOTCAL_0034g00130 [Botryotinia calthae]|uniref:Helicase C-terminal domain-containing protein n=1 Tax=Botryotinia calthae TaxID=38488 RepID=A0A4Y8DFJ5_9HELO|nr:hypothetical protein BOTCAL_0034g00130 [Botryotinia calthae]
MAPPTPISDDPLQAKRSIGMKSIWSNMKKGTARQDPNQKNWSAQQIVSDSSFAAVSPPSRDSMKSYTNSCFSDLTNYIPAGSIRIHKHECSLLKEEAFMCRSWHAFHLPTDINNFQQSILYLPNTVQGQLLRSAALVKYTGIHDAGWIRMEFKAKDKNSGQVRVYILPDDIGNAVLDRSMKQLRKGMQALLDKLDISNAAWQGTWSDDTPIQHINSDLDGVESTDVISLFDMFNNLPSPRPDPSVVKGDHYVQDAMRSLLEGNVQGLHPDTQMHPFQCETAAMMLQRETTPGYILDPRLREIKDQHGRKFYCDLSANVPDEHSVDSIPKRKKTGSLLDMCASTIGRQGIPWELVLGKMESEEELGFSQMHAALNRGIGYYWHQSAPPCRQTRHLSPITRKIWLAKSTIVVVPPNLVHQWILEIQKHTTGLSYLVINDARSQVPPAHELAKYDIILFSRSRFEKEAGEETLPAIQSTITCEHCFGSVWASSCSCEISPEEWPVKAFRYRSPLRDIHFKRLITDEGHGFGNVTKSTNSNAAIMLKFLHLDARWIISGTPTNSLRGKDIEFSRTYELRSHDVKPMSLENSKTPPEKSFTNSNGVSIEQETKDLEKLGNILKSYLKARPWANTAMAGDQASWLDLVIKPRYNRQIHGDAGILKSTLESMIIRHTARDITGQLRLPRLNKKIVNLEGCFQDKLSLNIFSMMITINAVTSEREGIDYFFHPKNRRALLNLFSNLRQASFTWSGYTKVMIESSIQTAEKFLTKDDISPEDKKLLREAIRVGELALTNGIFTAVSQLHEMAMYVQNPLQKEIRRTWALDYHDRYPTLMGASMICVAKKAFHTYHRRGLDYLSASSFDTGKLNNIGENSMRRIAVDSDIDLDKFRITQAGLTEHRPRASPDTSTSSKNFMWEDSTITSTASSKLSYLMDQVFLHHNNEKIIIFYEAENVGYYIAQALKCVNIEHLVYTKRDSTSERSKCVAKFNSIKSFRVILMDVNQAAFGLDMSAASRVYFVSPVFSPQVEAQAIKRSHRIGQLRPVHVETLVLKGSIEEVILTRRSKLNDQEHTYLKNILDDQTIYDWIKNVRFYPIASGKLSGPEQLAPLSHPQLAFEKFKDPPNDQTNARVREMASRTLEPLRSNFTESRGSVLGYYNARNVGQLGDLHHSLGREISNYVFAIYREGLRERFHEQEIGLNSWIDDLMDSHQMVSASTSDETESSHSARGVRFGGRIQPGLTTESGQPIFEGEEADENDHTKKEDALESVRAKRMKARSTGNNWHNELMTQSEVSRALAQTEAEEDDKEETERDRGEQGEGNHGSSRTPTLEDRIKEMSETTAMMRMPIATDASSSSARRPSSDGPSTPSIFGRSALPTSALEPSDLEPSFWESLRYAQASNGAPTRVPPNTRLIADQLPNEELAAEIAENVADEDMEDAEVADAAENAVTSAESDAHYGNLYDA